MVPAGLGYGTSWVHLFDKYNGTYLSSFGGAGKDLRGKLPSRPATPRAAYLAHPWNLSIGCPLELR
jgi:hypothetical protein